MAIRYMSFGTGTFAISSCSLSNFALSLSIFLPTLSISLLLDLISSGVISFGLVDLPLNNSFLSTIFIIVCPYLLFNNSISKNVNSKLRINKEDSLPLSKYNNQRNEESSYLKENSGLKEFNINYSQKESNFKNPFETKDAENVSKNDDPFAPNPTLSMTYSGIKPTMKDPFNIPAMKDPFNMPSMKDPFNVTTTKDPFNMPSMKDPFSGENQKNSFETNEKQNNDMPFKESGLSLGMKTLNSKVQMNPYNLNLLKNCSNSPLGGYLFTGIDGNLANSNRFYKPGVFQTPTSRGVFNPRFADNNERKNETGSFGASPKDISTTKAVFNQQTHFEKGKESEAETPQRAFNRDLHTPSNNYFGNSPAYIYANYQNAFGPNYGNTPTGGSFGASPAAWIFNMPSPYTGYANNYLSPFNQGQQFEPKETNQEQSPKFNSITESNRQPINQYPTGQDSARAFNASLASAFNKLQGIPNYAPSPANAFSFSCVSDSSPMTSNQPYFKFPPKDMNQINKNDSSPRPNQK